MCEICFDLWSLEDTHSILGVNEGVIHGNDFDIIMLDASRR